MNYHNIHLGKTRKRIYFFLIGILLCLGLGILASCFQPPTTPLFVGSNEWPGFAPLYLAKELGYYQNSSIKIVDYPSTTEINRAIRGGNLQAGAISLDETLLLAETFPQIRVILLVDLSNGADVILGKPQLNTLSDIKGKKVGVENTALGAYLLSRALDQVGLSVQDIKIVSLGYSEHEAAFKQGEIDAVVTFEPVRSKLIATGAKVLFDSSKIPGEIVDVLVVRQDIIETHSKDLEQLIRGWFMALDYLKQQPESAAQIMAERVGITPKEFLSSLKLLKFFTPVENQTLLSQTDPSLVKASQNLSKLMQEKKLLNSDIQFSSLLDQRFVTQFYKSNP
ncbi:ABC transporter substrate-binding protein [Planktothrix mougeotii]|uniref:ABC transporter substrate-binding protein n=1 Tax=Planktothrix mougeotii LEGE 06226 TaxID=1828728 RepID=A0ABR9U8F4_9CYAN|nr:ABC transporter substrate-binding protein [Planktothrix mougeotii]MBE9142481.1 ABC transporter substrate-binding protein [Planktothrix mougeotii LEGE 06226]